MTRQKVIKSSLEHIFRGINDLRNAFDNRRQFTIDGRLVGDIGEVIAELEYDLIIDDVSQPGHDATTPNQRRVQIKATFKDSLTLSTVPDLYLGLKIFEDGSFEEIYNGPGHIISARYAHRKGIGEKLLSFPVRELRNLQPLVPSTERVARRLTALADTKNELQ